MNERNVQSEPALHMDGVEATRGHCGLNIAESTLHHRHRILDLIFGVFKMDTCSCTWTLELLHLEHHHYSIKIT